MGYYGNRELVERARELRKNMTHAERKLWTRLRSKKIQGYKFRRQEPIFDFIVDFYCPELKLIIEVDGEIHSLKESRIYDKRRDEILKTNGYQLIRFSNSEILNNIDNIIEQLTAIISINLSPSQGDHRG